MKARKMRVLSFTVCVLFALFPTFAQRKVGPISKKPAQAKNPSLAKRTPNYSLRLRIAEGPKLSVSVFSADRKDEIEPQDLSSLIADLPAGGDKFNTPNNVFPKVLVEPSPNISMLDLWNPITLFRRDRTEIAIPLSLSAADGAPSYEVLLDVPWRSETLLEDVKPNPLWLIVTVGDDDKLRLNGEPYGSLTNTEPLSKKLQEIFKQREENGVFREGDNEIEKSVTIAMPMSRRKVSDLMVIARAVWLPGGKPISLSMEDPLEGFSAER